MRVNVAIIAHDNPKVMLDASIGSVLLEKSEIHQLFLVDNSSTDRLRKHYDALTTYIYPGKNLGFGAANNIAMRRSIDESVDYHLLVNPDIYFNQGTIRELLDFMDAHPDVGLVSPKVVYPNGTTQHLCKLIPTPADLIGRRFLGWGPFKQLTDRRNEFFELQFSGYEALMEVPILSGSFMLIRTSVLEKVGLFDERFFLYLEDFDLCRRIGEVSRTVFYPYTSVVHEYEKGSYFNRRLFGHHIVSAIKYFSKWGWLFDRKRRKTNQACLAKLQSHTATEDRVSAENTCKRAGTAAAADRESLFCRAN